MPVYFSIQNEAGTLQREALRTQLLVAAAAAAAGGFCRPRRRKKSAVRTHEHVFVHMLLLFARTHIHNEAREALFFGFPKGKNLFITDRTRVVCALFLRVRAVSVYGCV